jgi:hypothetical protein
VLGLLKNITIRDKRVHHHRDKAKERKLKMSEISEYESQLKRIDELLERAGKGLTGNREYTELHPAIAKVGNERDRLAKRLDVLKKISPSDLSEQILEKAGPMGIWDAMAQQLEKLMERIGRKQRRPLFNFKRTLPMFIASSPRSSDCTAVSCSKCWLEGRAYHVKLLGRSGNPSQGFGDFFVGEYLYRTGHDKPEEARSASNPVNIRNDGDLFPCLHMGDAYLHVVPHGSRSKSCESRS